MRAWPLAARWCHSGVVPLLSAITAAAVLTSAGDVEQASSSVRAALGFRVDLERDGDEVLVARCGSRAAYRLLGAWARPSWLPMRARFELTAHQGATQVAVSMTSDAGWYLATASLASSAYQARFEQLVADLQRADLDLDGIVEHGLGGAGSVAR